MSEQRRARIQIILENLQEGLYERDTLVTRALLAALSGESMFLLGPPGVAKSLIARRLKFVFKNATSFEYLMHRFSTPDEIFGPISISKLKNEDKLERNIKGYLPSANIAFLDEIWKAGPSIQNTLLTILNEKVFRNGEQEFPVNLYTVISASNELPEKNQGLEALWDRFLFREIVSNIQNREAFLNMVSSTIDLYEDPIPSALKISIEEFKQWQTELDSVDIPEEILSVIYSLRVMINEYNEKIHSDKKQDENIEPLYVSDRRWKKIIRVLRAAAFFSGRTKVEYMDLFLLPYLLWNEPGHLDYLLQLVDDILSQHAYIISTNYSSIQKAINALDSEVQNEIYISVPEKTLDVISKSNTDFYVLEQPYRSYSLIKTSDWERLKINNQQRVHLYTMSLSSNYFYITKLSDDTFTFDYAPVKLRYTTITRKEKRVPHRAVVEEWERRWKELTENISKELQKLRTFETEFKNNLTKYLFSPRDKADLLLARIQQSQREFQELQIHLNQIRNEYQSLKKEKKNGHR